VILLYISFLIFTLGCNVLEEFLYSYFHSFYFHLFIDIAIGAYRSGHVVYLRFAISAFKQFRTFLYSTVLYWKFSLIVYFYLQTKLFIIF